MAETGQDAAGIAVESIGEHAVQIRLDREERLNALGWDMVKRMLAEVEAAIAGGARVLLVRGTGRGFCSGADLKARRDMPPADRVQHNADINRAIDAIAAAPIPTIAVVNGLALGGGCELALACDLRIAAAGIRIGLTETRIGVIPGAGGTQRLPRLIGTSRALELMLLGEPIDAERAAEIGLVNQVVPAERLDERAREIAAVIASRSPLGVRAIKRVVHDGAALPLAEGLKLEREALKKVLASADYAEGLAAFEQKRQPVFGRDPV